MSSVLTVYAYLQLTSLDRYHHEGSFDGGIDNYYWHRHDRVAQRYQHLLKVSWCMCVYVLE